MQTIPGGMPIKTFFAKYWQKKPLLVRGALLNLKQKESRDSILNVSTNPDMSSRLVRYDPKADQWHLSLGPFQAEDFKRLKGKPWTILVQDMDIHSQAVNDVLDSFQFIPQWRTDDIMISYASKGGNVGPHVDNYDVFLIQAQGRRRWQIEKKKNLQDDFRDDCDLRILKSFAADHTWDLEPGDMLYLPPRIPHYGVSLDDSCITYSVGYRAPRYIDLLQEFISSEENAPSLFNFYEDPCRNMAPFAGEVAGKDLQEIYRHIADFKMNEDNFKRWMLRQLSEPKYDFMGQDTRKKKRLNGLSRALGTKALYTIVKGKPYLCVNGQDYSLGKRDLKFCQLITSKKYLSRDDLKAFTDKQRLLVNTWLDHGWFKDIELSSN